jgi:arylsulfatase A-like enzyme
MPDDTTTDRRPNVLLITGDDLGWRDLGCYGSPFYETPNLDALAQESAMFTDAYASCPVCSPTRASLQTGQYPARVGITNFIAGQATGKVLEPEYNFELPESETTIADVLSAAGYATWHTGKWHLTDSEDSYPGDHGYDENVAGCDWGSPGGSGYFSPWGNPMLEDGPEGEYLTDRLGRESAAMIENHDDSESPFFLNHNCYAVHTPLEGKEEYVERYEARRRMLGLDDVTEIEEDGRFPCEHKKDRRIQRRQVQSDPVYAAMVRSMDEAVGRILEAAESCDRETVVIFTSDNGGLATSEGSPTCNDPLAEGKGWMYEGGNRVPLLVRWPGVTDAGDVVETPATSTDVVPTICEAAGVDPAAAVGDVGDFGVDGESLRAPLTGGDLGRDAVFWHYPHYGNQGGTPTGAIRTERWKLIEFYEDDHVELYDLSGDVSEARDVSGEHPERTATLRDRLAAWREDVGAKMPQPNPEYEPWPDRAGPGQ